MPGIELSAATNVNRRAKEAAKAVNMRLLAICMSVG